jgi:hypothetical protein
MKNHCLLFCSLLSAFSLLAQSENRLGLTVGLNYTQLILNENSEAEQSGRLGFYTGFAPLIRLSDKFSFRPGLILAYQSVNYLYKPHESQEDPFIPIGSNGTAHLDVDANINEVLVQLPLRLSYQFCNKFTLTAGPFGEYVLQERVVHNNDNAFDIGNVDDYKMGLGYSAGIEYNPNGVNAIQIHYLNRLTVRNQMKTYQLQLGYLHFF